MLTFSCIDIFRPYVDHMDILFAPTSFTKQRSVR